MKGKYLLERWYLLRYWFFLKSINLFGSHNPTQATRPSVLNKNRQTWFNRMLKMFDVLLMAVFILIMSEF